MSRDALFVKFATPDPQTQGALGKELGCELDDNTVDSKDLVEWVVIIADEISHADVSRKAQAACFALLDNIRKGLLADVLPPGSNNVH